jgi:Tfp pilus assembly protein FimT
VGAVFGGGALVLSGVLAMGLPLAWNEGQRIYRIGFLGDSYVDANADGQWQQGELLTRDSNGNGSYDQSQYHLLKRWLEQHGCSEEVEKNQNSRHLSLDSIRIK